MCVYMYQAGEMTATIILYTCSYCYGYIQFQFPNSCMHNVCMCLISDFCIESYKRSIEARNRKTQRFSYSGAESPGPPK